MKKFQLTWRETLTKTITIEAENKEKAEDLFHNDEYKEEDVEVLDGVFHGIKEFLEV